MSEPPLKVGAEGIEVEPKKVGHRHIDMIVAGVAILLSLVSLGVAIKHGLIMQKLVAANSWPLLQYSTGNLDETSGAPLITMEVVNAGVGPAIVKDLALVYGGKRYSNAHDFLRDCCGYRVPQSAQGRIGPGGVVSDQIANSVIRPGEKGTLLRLDRSPEIDAAWSRLERERFNVSFRSCYCSVLGECWQSDLVGVSPQPVDSCPNPEPRQR